MDSILMWAFLGFLILAGMFTVRAVYGYARLPKEAADDWDYKVSERMDDPNLTKDGYINAYGRAHAPRRDVYLAVTLAVLAVMTPAALALLNAVLTGLDTLDKADAKTTKIVIRGVDIGGLTYEPGNMVYGFIVFFGIVGIWTAMIAIAARRYYRRAPGTLHEEMLRERMK